MTIIQRLALRSTLICAKFVESMSSQEHIIVLFVKLASQRGIITVCGWTVALGNPMIARTTLRCPSVLYRCVLDLTWHWLRFVILYWFSISTIFRYSFPMIAVMFLNNMSKYFYSFHDFLFILKFVWIDWKFLKSIETLKGFNYLIPKKLLINSMLRIIFKIFSRIFRIKSLGSWNSKICLYLKSC